MSTRSSDADGPVPTYLDLLKVTAETIAKGSAGMNAPLTSRARLPATGFRSSM